ncbi:adenylosuccinate lyase [Olivibacter ginsenosidimutans]|uniref:Adenylosuccinate lyase n=1 Tax=Olivibacter ginsenosidimutans TaxID=1176537 RepID=A0ABP9AY99_9SPHI
MVFSPLTAISPVDGRYHHATKELSSFFSEAALIRYRVFVEIEYFIALATEIPQLEGFTSPEDLRNIYRDFSEVDTQRIKELEKTTNHDVKAVEYFIKEKFDALGLQGFKEFIHFGLTSQDINNTAIPYSWKEAMHKVYYPHVEELLNELESLVSQWQTIPMLAKTHGQPASPTRLGKEFGVFVERLKVQLQQIQQIPFSAKFGGATGNFNAHHVAYPEHDWISFGNDFVNKQLQLSRSQTTTQIEHYDNFAAHCDGLKRVNTILIDLCRDIWAYISMDYFKQQIIAGQIGSSAMPHKVNPIDFENAEGNLGLANALFEYLAAKLPISRLQRDLTDSTVLRNIGVPFAHTLIAFTSIMRGLKKLILNEEALKADLEKNWAVVAEAIQTILRREGYPKPYEALKDLTRTNRTINQIAITNFIDQLDVTDDIKAELKKITPWSYTGV